MAEQAPRINSQYLDAFTGQTVTITGKVSQIRGETAIIDANGDVTVLLNRVCTPCHNHNISRQTNIPADCRCAGTGIASPARNRCRDCRQGESGPDGQGTKVDKYGE
jgi:hypothetical protein